eukprot:sb/3475003/
MCYAQISYSFTLKDDDSPRININYLDGDNGWVILSTVDITSEECKDQLIWTVQRSSSNSERSFYCGNTLANIEYDVKDGENIRTMRGTEYSFSQGSNYKEVRDAIDTSLISKQLIKESPGGGIKQIRSAGM